MKPILFTILSLTLASGTVWSEDLPGQSKPNRPAQDQGRPHGPGQGDGKTSDEERAAIKKRLEALKDRNPELFKKIDQDGNGELSPEEMRRAREIVQQQGDKFREEILKRFDKDGDGKLNDEERAAARAALEARSEELKEKHPELFKKLDKDGDGKLDPQELRQAREWLERHRGDGKGDGKDRSKGEFKGKGPGAGGNRP